MSEKIPNFEYKLDQENDDKNQDILDSESKKHSETESSPEKKSNEELKIEIEKFREDAERMLKLNKSMFEYFCDSITPRLQFSDGVLMDFKEMKIHLDTNFFYKKGFNQEQMLWAAYHELSHFRDLMSDPRRFLENFKHIKEKAEEYGEKIRQFKSVEKKEFSEEEKEKGYLDPYDAKAYKSWHTFYNCLDDIYVNSLVGTGVAFRYGEKHGRHKGEVGNLYRETLFKGTDYSKLPKSRQFSYALLRYAMLPDEKLELDKEVEKVLDKEIDWLGKKITVRDAIDEIKTKSTKVVKAGDRYYLLRKTLEPIFEELYQKDLEEWQENEQKKEEEKQKQEQEKQDRGQDENGQEDQQQDKERKDGDENQEGNKGDGQDQQNEENQEKDSNGDDQQDQQNEENGEKKEGGQENGDSESNQEGEEDQNGSETAGSKEENLDSEFDAESKKQQSKPDPTMPDFPIDPKDLDDDDIDKIIQQIEDFKGQQEKPKEDFQEKAKEREERQKQKWCEENQISRETLRDYEKIKEEIQPYLNSLSKVWDSIIYGQGVNKERSKTNSSEGEVNIDRVIKYYADIISGQAKEVKPMEKKTIKELPSDKPETIRVRFIGDASGSMNSEKQEVLKKVYVLVMSSLRDFETKLNRTRTKNKSKLSVQTEGWIFGDNAVKLKSFRKGRDYSAEFAETIRQFDGLTQNLGYTYDNTVYENIVEQLSVKDKKDIQSKKILDIAFEVTDGGSNDPALTREAVDNLEKTGMIIRSFQIGQTGSSEDESFNYVWNDDAREQRGFKVGTDLDKLVPAIAGALKKYVGNVRI